MARRTKLETEQTRCRILAAARATFLERGVSGTTLETIAEAAGVTRGAIYWHFENKKALYDAMRAQVCLPLIDRTDVELPEQGRADPLACIQQFLLKMFDAVTAGGEQRQTFEIMAFKCEYVGEFEKELLVHRAQSSKVVDMLTRQYARAKRLRQMRPGLTPRLAAVETLAFMTGLIRLTLLDPQSGIERPAPGALIRSHVENRRYAHSAASAAHGVAQEVRERRQRLTIFE